MYKTCPISSQQFTIDPEDQIFYKKQEVPEPTLCPDERQRRRLMFRNERNLYTRKDSLTGETIISRWTDDTPFPVYNSRNWWSDNFDPLEYGQDFDFNKTFFEQFTELRNKVPRISLYNFDSVNSEYTNHAGYNKNSYMCFNTAKLEDCYYITNFAIGNKDCCDCYAIENSELLYECFMCDNCYSSRYLVNCNGCHDSHFLFDCRNCQDCFMCWNLRSKKYCIRNEQKTREEYGAYMKTINIGSHKEFSELAKEFKSAVKNKAIHKSAFITKSENCTGDYITNAKNSKQSYYAIDCEDVKYSYEIYGAKDCFDTYEAWKNVERNYETHACNETQFMIGCDTCIRSAFLNYCDNCHNSKYLTGCISLKKNEYCILNKQYTKEEYEKLLTKIKEHMIKTKEWGEFFPHSLAPFPYNDSKAQDYYPLSKEKALARGYTWRDKDKQDFKPATLTNLPDTIAETPDSITQEILACEKTGKNYRITPQEFKFYKRQNIPTPHRHPDTRYEDRKQFRHKRKLTERTCPTCKTKTLSIFKETDPEKILCEKCYLAKAY